MSTPTPTRSIPFSSPLYIPDLNLSESLGLVSEQLVSNPSDPVSGIAATLTVASTITSAFSNSWRFAVPVSVLSNTSTPFDFTQFQFYYNSNSTLTSSLTLTSFDITTASVNTSLLNPKDSVITDYLKYIASCIYSTRQGITLFNNTDQVKSSLSSQVLTDYKTKLLNNNNIAQLLFNQIVYSDPTFLSTITTANSISSVPLTINGVQFMEFKIPVIAGDSIISNLTLNPNSLQNSTSQTWVTNHTVNIGPLTYAIKVLFA